MQDAISIALEARAVGVGFFWSFTIARTERTSGERREKLGLMGFARVARNDINSPGAGP